jgi:hypothetical protein
MGEETAGEKKNCLLDRLPRTNVIEDRARTAIKTTYS